MCNLYRLGKSLEEVAALFGSAIPDLAIAPAGNAPHLIYPGYPGIVVTGHAVQQMVWGFPLARTGVKGQPLKPKPVNNARDDKLSSPFWSASFRDRRCLIPVSGFAEAAGAKGSMTRTWFTAPDDGVLAMAGIWRETAEWGAAYSMIMTEAVPPVTAVHNRMPVILARKDWASWLNAQPPDARALCQAWHGGLQMTATAEPWAGRA